MFQNNYFKSKVFKRLFFSYIIIISLCFGIYSVMAIYETVSLNKERKNTFYEIKLSELSSFWDSQFYTARNIAFSLNSSAYIKKLYMSVLSDTDRADSYTMYQASNVISTAKTASRNLNISEVMLFLNTSNKVYCSSEIVWMKKAFKNRLEQGKQISKDSVQNLLKLDSMYNLNFTKEYLIFSEDYTYQTSQVSPSKGLICVLFDLSAINDSVNAILNERSACRVYLNDEVIYQSKGLGGVLFRKEATSRQGITYELVVDNSEFGFEGNTGLSLMIVFGFVGCILFAILAYHFANKYYLPIGNIEKIMNEEIDKKAPDELESIIKGIEGLIGERNGYKERMVTIAPYAEQGMLHGILNGNVGTEKINVLWQEEYIDLRRPYFTVSVVNIAYTGTEKIEVNEFVHIANLIQRVSKKFFTEELNIVCYTKDLYHIYMVVNSDNADLEDDFFFQLHESMTKELQNESFIMTMGVDQIRDDITLLQEACNHALKALNGMLVGGRGNVYFYEQEVINDKREYYFPKDFVKKVEKTIKDNNLLELKELLDDIYTRNTTEYDCSLETIQCLVDELHISMLKAIKCVNPQNTTHINIDKIKSSATLEETFQYYYAAIQLFCEQLQKITINKRDAEQLEREILEYINVNYKDPNISLAAMTEKFGVSNKYITLCCKQYLGQTYLQYIQEKRILYAKQLLEEGTLTLEQVAEQCGYTNPLTFRRNFKSIVGMNPSDYRNE